MLLAIEIFVGDENVMELENYEAIEFLVYISLHIN